jgi:hypothetical protein
MKTLAGLSWLSALSATLSNGLGVNAQNNTPSAWPLHDNGLNDVVQWDHYSFKVNGKRLFVFSGEIHYWRIPVYEVWEDLLEKIKAAGEQSVTQTELFKYANHHKALLLSHSMATGPTIARTTKPSTLRTVPGISPSSSKSPSVLACTSSPDLDRMLMPRPMLEASHYGLRPELTVSSVMTTHDISRP